MKKHLLLIVCCSLFCSCEKDIQIQHDTFTDLRDNHLYKSVTIGSQTWLAENLAYLPAVSHQKVGSNDEPHYYVYDYEGTNVDSAMEADNYITYGVLYNWASARAACPKGWHLPAYEEWIELSDYLGDSPVDMMKSTSGWAYDGQEYNGDNSSGFNALPAGHRRVFGNGFCFLGIQTNFWTSSIKTDDGRFDIWEISFAGYFHTLGRGYTQRNCGLSVRCIKDD